MEGKNGPSLLPAGLRPPEQPQLFHTPLNDTKSSFTGPTVRTYGTPPTPSPLEKEDSAFLHSIKNAAFPRNREKRRVRC